MTWTGNFQLFVTTELHCWPFWVANLMGLKQVIIQSFQTNQEFPESETQTGNFWKSSPKNKNKNKNNFYLVLILTNK